MMKLPPIDHEAMEREMERLRQERLETERSYAEMSVKPDEIGKRQGLVHAASILVWAKLAEIGGVPFIPVETVASIPMALVEKMYDHEDQITEEDLAILAPAREYCASGGFWRTELCAASAVKSPLSRGLPVPELLEFDLYDMRIFDMHYGMPDIKIIGRPRMTPVMHAGWPVEFRTFFGGAAEDGAASWYYPQTGRFDVTPELERHMDKAIEMGRHLHDLREALGLVPTLVYPPTVGPEIGSTIDFMLTEERGLVMVDAGPGFGFGAHPCCGIDVPVKGRMWHLADGVEPR